MKLSDLYVVEEEEVSLELTALLLNINPGYNEELMNMRQTRAEGYEDGEAAGMIKGEAIGRQQINQLNILLEEQNRTVDIIKAANDPEYQKKLLEEFSL